MIVLRPYSNEDFCILERTLGDPLMMEHLGGIETPEQIARRHQSYLNESAPGEPDMFTILFGADSTRVGTIGFWERTWQGEQIYESGWMVLPGYAGRGIATQAAFRIVQRAVNRRRHPSLHAFPSTSNPASNAVCQKVGFTNLGECIFEYPKGSFMQCNDWRIELHKRPTLREPQGDIWRP